jgi:polyhydroxybutyrate depolymerase
MRGRHKAGGAVLAAAALVAVAVLSGCGTALASDDETLAGAPTIDVNGATRTYYLYAPGGPAHPRPLFVMLHGGTGTARKQEKYTSFDAFAAKNDLAVVYPEGVGKQWNDGRIDGQRSTADDLSFLRALIAELEKSGLADPKRVYITGLSNGAMMSLHAACNMSDVIAGIAAVAGNQPVDAGCPSPRPMPVMLFHGTDDKVVPFAGGPILGHGGAVKSNDETAAMWAKENGCANPARTNLPDVDADDGTTVDRVTYACPPGQGLELFIIDGGGHTWPGAHRSLVTEMLLGKTTHDIDANAEEWRFFQQQYEETRKK